jgi:hypothetical protein
MGAQIVEREWDSLAAMEAAMNGLHEEIASQRVWEKYSGVKISQRLEILGVEG